MKIDRNIPIAFVHGADHDGLCSGALLKKYYDNLIEVHTVDYSDKEIAGEKSFDDNFDIKNRTVYICDFSFKPAMMKKIIEASKETIWLDHHFSAINAVVYSGWFQEMIRDFTEGTANKIGQKFFYSLNMTDKVPFSGAYLTWAWLYNNHESGLAHDFIKNPETKKFDLVQFKTEYEMDDSVKTIVNDMVDMDIMPSVFEFDTENQVKMAWDKCPKFIKLISMRDTWVFVNPDDFNYSTYVMYGMDAIGMTDLNSVNWEIMLSDVDPECMRYDLIGTYDEVFNQIIQDGQAIDRYKKLYEFPKIAKNMYDVKFELNGKTIRGLAINAAKLYSDAFICYDPVKHDFCIKYNFNKNHWDYSVYVMPDKKDKYSAVDIVHLIDETGGGHKGAAGGRSESLYRKLI